MSEIPMWPNGCDHGLPISACSDCLFERYREALKRADLADNRADALEGALRQVRDYADEHSHLMAMAPLVRDIDQVLGLYGTPTPPIGTPPEASK